MNTSHEETRTLALGETATPSAPDEATVAKLAARNLERVLVRGSNARIAAALVDLARELACSASFVRVPPLCL